MVLIYRSRYSPPGQDLFFAYETSGKKTIWVGTEGTIQEVKKEIKKRK